MTEQNHPFNPPPELVRQWAQWKISDMDPEDVWFRIADSSAQWGAEQMWEACRSEIIDGIGMMHIASMQGRLQLVDDLGRAICSKPPSLKQQALEALDEEQAELSIQNYKLIRAVLKSLPDQTREFL